MENFVSSYSGKVTIYKEQLQNISGISFTSREIDIIACVLHNRGEKKIASLLSIAHKTVSAHVRNIMLKLGASSREYLIDFIEKSGKLYFCRQYYLHLLILASFEQKLQKIGKTLNKTEVMYALDSDGDERETQELYAGVKNHLKLANVILAEKNSKVTNGILRITDFPVAQNYYSSIFALLKKIIDKNEIEDVIKEFEHDCKAIQGNLTVQSNQHVPKIINQHKAILAFAVCLVLCLFILIPARLFDQEQDVDNVQIQNINEKFAAFAKDLSAGCVLNDSLQKKHAAIKHLEEIVTQIDQDKKLKEYFNGMNLSPNELLNCLYNLHLVANYYTYEYNGEKARKILLFAKSMSETYVNKKSKVPVDFEKLNPEEIYAELRVTKGLPEMYTRIIYLLGRTYIYQGDKKLAVGYFKLSKYLGEKLALLEGYLSVRSGLEVIKDNEINDDLVNKNYVAARRKLLESIETYKDLKSSNVEYKVNYNPSLTKTEVITPKNDLFNTIECSEKIADRLCKLLFLTDDVANQEHLIKEITDQFIGETKSSGLLLLMQSKEISSKKVAGVYNTLGNILLKAHDKGMDFVELKKAAVKILNLKTADDLELAYQIFLLAKSKSRNTEFTKADSYDGLIRVYEQRLKKANTTEAHKIQIEITTLKAERDAINKALNRIQS